MKIDRSKWEQCEMCVSCGNCWYAKNDKDYVPCNKCVEFDQFDPVGFCRACGRPLTEDDWEELEKKVFGE